MSMDIDYASLVDDVLAGVMSVDDGGNSDNAGDQDQDSDVIYPDVIGDPLPYGVGDGDNDGSDDGEKAQLPIVIEVKALAPEVPVVDAAAVVNAFDASQFAGNAVVTKGGLGKKNLTAASRQWANRPPDERFWTVQEMAQACREHKENSAQVKVDLGRVQVVSDNGGMVLMGGGLNGPAGFTHYSFGQLCRVSGAPADYLRDLDGELAAKCLESGLRKKERDVLGASGNVLVRNARSDDKSIGAFLSGGYSRIWNADVVSRLGEFENRGWRVPPARPAGFDDPRARLATEADVLKNNKGGGGIEVKVGDLIAPAGLYASDKDCFAFMVMEGNGFDDGGSQMSRGFFVSNSEVGDRAFSLTTFLYDAVCGNHIVWGASEVTEVRLVHRGNASHRWVHDLQTALKRYAANGTEKERQAIRTAIGTQIGHDRDSVIEKLFKDKRLGLTKRVIENAWDWAVKEARLRGNKFSPTSVWGMVCGLTRVSQETGWACDRVAIDLAAGKMLALAS